MNGLQGVSKGKGKNTSRRRLLEDELRLIQEQRVAIQRQLELAKSDPVAFAASRGKPAFGRSPPATTGIKRLTDGLFETRESKRARIEHERNRRVNAIWQTCNSILKALRKPKEAFPFLTPVDAEALRIPDYYIKIKRPMDLGTVGKKLEHRPERGQFRAYKDPMEFRDDVRLVWENCRTYNLPGTPVRIMGDNMSDNWEKRWVQAGVEAKWEEEVRRQRAEEMELSGQADLSADQLPDRLRELNQGLYAAHAKVEQAHLPRPIVAPPHRGMTFEEKRKLSQRLSSLNDDQLAPVITIIAEALGPMQDNNGEVELDIDALGDDLLWKLDEYINVHCDDKNKAKKPPAPVEGGAAGGAPGPTTNPGAPQQQGDQETTSRPAEGGARKTGTSGSTSGDSAGDEGGQDGGSEEVGSKENVGSTYADGRDPAKARPGDGNPAGDVTTFVSATRPAQTNILKANKEKKEVNVQNAAAWTSLAQAPGTEGEGEKPEEAAAQEDELWKEFASREQQQQQVAQAKQDAEAAQQKQREEEIRAAREAAEKQRAEEEAQRAQKAKEEADRIAALKAKEAAQLEELSAPKEEPMEEDQANLAVGVGANPLGLQMVDNSDDEDDDSDDSGESG